MYGARGAIHIAGYNFFKKSGLSSGGTIFPLRVARPGPLGRPAIIHAIDPIPGTKMMITSQDHFGRLRIFDSGVREQSIKEKIVKAVTMIAPINVALITGTLYRSASNAAIDSSNA